MITISSPVFNSNEDVVGNTAVDLSVDVLVEHISQIELEDNEFIAVTSINGLYLKHPDKSLMRKHFSLNPNITSDVIKKYNKQFRQGKPFEMTVDYLDSSKTKKYQVYYYPIIFKDMSQTFILCIYLSYERISKEALSTLYKNIVIFVLISLFSFFLIFFSKNSLNEITAEEQKYKFITENTNDIIWAFDFNTMKYTYLSPSLKKLTGYEIDEVIGKDVSFLFSEETHHLTLNHLHEVLEKYRKEQGGTGFIAFEGQLLDKYGDVI